MKKILYICSNSPFENSYGAQQRTSLLCDALCEVGVVDIVCFTNEKQPDKILKQNCAIHYFGELPKKSKSLFSVRLLKIINILSSLSPYSIYTRNKFASSLISNLLQTTHYDYIVVRYIENAFTCGLYTNKDVIVDVDDMPEQSIISYADSIKKSIFKTLQYKFYARRANFFTDRFLKHINHSFIPVESQCVWGNSSYLPNIPILNKDLVTEINQNELMKFQNQVFFVGLMRHTPNVIGVDYFINNIWAKVIELVPNAVFKVAGSGLESNQKIVWEKNKGVQVLGFVQDLVDEYRKSKVVVVPIYHGAGTNIKVLEAMSMKKACVISEVALRGFENDLIDGENVLIAKNDQEFVDKILRLLVDNDFNILIAKNGSDKVTEKYSYSVFRDSVHKYIN